MNELDKKEKEIERISEEQNKQLVRAYQDVFRSSEGQLVFWDLINKCHVFREFHDRNANIYALEGMREIGLHLLRTVMFTETLGGPGPAEMQKIVDSLYRTGKFKKTKEVSEDG